MPISALVITLTHDAEKCDTALNALALEADLELGPPSGRRFPAVAETTSLNAGRQLVERLQQVPGIVQVDVIGINFEDDEPG